MGKIIIKGKSGYTDCPKEDLDKLNGIGDETDFVEYSEFKHKLNSGFMSFIVENNILYTLTTYDTKEEFSEEDLKKLGEETQGQWSDGIGEGFEQNPCIYINNKEIYISPWEQGQELIIKQEI